MFFSDKLRVALRIGLSLYLAFVGSMELFTVFNVLLYDPGVRAVWVIVAVFFSVLSLVAAVALIPSPKVGGYLALAALLPQTIGISTPVLVLSFSQGLLGIIGFSLVRAVSGWEFRPVTDFHAGGSWAFGIHLTGHFGSGYGLTINLVAVVLSLAALQIMRMPRNRPTSALPVVAAPPGARPPLVPR